MNPENRKSDSLSYKDAGVDIDAGNRLVDLIKPMVKTTTRAEVLTGLGGFGGLFQLDLERHPSPVLVSGTDGVGTKLMLARMLDRHDTIGIDLVAMCVNDILTCGAEPLFFLDYYATGKLEPEFAATVVSGIAEGCRQSGCALIGGETAEMPGMYDGDDYDLAGFCVGVVDRDQIIDGNSIRPGHKILGIGSSGPHSNGYSLIRKVLEHSQLDPATLLEGTEQTLAEALLAPTRIYTSLLGLRDVCSVDGMAHITGGGLTENIIRIIPAGLGIDIDLNSWAQPAVFGWLQEAGNIKADEMLRTFNCGIGLTILVAADEAQVARQWLNDAGETVIDLGEVTHNEGVRYIKA